MSQPLSRKSAASQSSKFEVRRHFGLRAKILGRLHQSDAEQLLPEAIDRHPRRQRLIGRHQPAGETQAIRRRVGAERRASLPARRPTVRRRAGCRARDRA